RIRWSRIRSAAPAPPRIVGEKKKAAFPRGSCRSGHYRERVPCRARRRAALPPAGDSASGAVVLAGEVPVDDVPVGFQELRPDVAVIDVVGMLPDVAGEHGLD